MTFKFSVPAFIGRWLFPALMTRARTFGAARQNKRWWNGGVEATVTVKTEE